MYLVDSIEGCFEDKRELNAEVRDEMLTPLLLLV